MNPLTHLGLLWNVLTDGDVIREVIHDATREFKDDARDSARDVLIALFVLLPLGVGCAVVGIYLLWYRIVQ